MIDMSGSGKKEVAALLVSDPYEESNSRTNKALDHTGDTPIKHNKYDSAAKIASKKVKMEFKFFKSMRVFSFGLKPFFEILPKIAFMKCH